MGSKRNVYIHTAHKSNDFHMEKLILRTQIEMFE